MIAESDQKTLPRDGQITARLPPSLSFAKVRPSSGVAPTGKEMDGRLGREAAGLLRREVQGGNDMRDWSKTWFWIDPIAVVGVGDG